MQNKFIRVNTKTKEIKILDVPEKYRFHGKRGLVDRFLIDEVPPQCDPLGPENKLIFCTGTFGGSTFPVTGRMSAGGKSPLTGTIKEASVGGMIGPYMANQGIKMIALDDKPDDSAEWQILLIDGDGKPSLISAAEYMGLGTYAVCEKMFAKYGKNIAIMTLGPAGEKMYRSAAIMVAEMDTGFPCRAVGRGGLGALLGSRKIKAMVIEKAKNKVNFEYADRERFLAAQKKFVETCKTHPRIKQLQELGSSSVLNSTSQVGVVPHRNFSGLPLSEENKTNFTATKYRETVLASGGKTGCACHPGCIVKCSNVFHGKNGEYLTAGLEYETVALFGSNIENYDFHEVAKLDRICDDIGVDTIEMGCALGVCMEGGKIKWGDTVGAAALLEEMRAGTEFGKLLGDGTESVGKALGVTRIPTVKKQGMPAYDPRGFKGLGITYAVSTQGADHTFGIVMGPPMKDEELPGLAIESQITTAIANDFFCLFGNGILLADPTIIPDLYAGTFGGEWSMDRLREMAKETLRIERKFNEGAGFRDKDDRLPEFCLKAEPQFEGALPPFPISDENVQKKMKEIYEYTA